MSGGKETRDQEDHKAIKMSLGKDAKFMGKTETRVRRGNWVSHKCQ